MYLSKKDTDNLVDFFNALQKTYPKFEGELEEKYLNAGVSVLRLLKSRKKSNEYTRKFVAEKRKTNKNYGR